MELCGSLYGSRIPYARAFGKAMSRKVYAIAHIGGTINWVQASFRTRSGQESSNGSCSNCMSNWGIVGQISRRSCLEGIHRQIQDRQQREEPLLLDFKTRNASTQPVCHNGQKQLPNDEQCAPLQDCQRCWWSIWGEENGWCYGLAEIAILRNCQRLNWTFWQYSERQCDRRFGEEAGW